MEKAVSVIFTIILFFLSIFLQLFFFNNLNLFGVKPNFLLISTIVVSLYTNIYAGTIYSFILGVVADLIFGSNGMFTISYVIIGMLLGFFNENYMKENYLSIIIITIISVTCFELVQYFQSMIMVSRFINLFILLKQIILSVLLNSVLVFIICLIFRKIIGHVEKKQNKIYW